MKAAMQDLLEDLQGEEALREKLSLLQDMPPAIYGERDWEIVQALVQLLRMAAAHLEVVFSERGQVDFTALVQAATLALGEPEAPTDPHWHLITVSSICWWTSTRIPRSASMNCLCG